jgi:flagella basal body P-ring formation protein FlgA
MEKRSLIKVKFYEFTKEDAKNELNEYLSENYQNIDFKISKITLIGNRTFKDKDFDLVEIDFNGKGPKAGNNRGLFRIYSGEKIIKVRFISKLIKEVEIVCASNDLKKGDLLTDKNIFLKKISLEREKADYFTDFNHLRGLKLRRSYKKGEIITSAMTFKPSLITRGDDVQIVAISGSLSVVTKGIAGKDGHLGDMIPVLNKRSKKTITGEIVSSNSVMVAF